MFQYSFQKMLIQHLIKLASLALAGVAQWIECQSENHKVDGLIPSQGTCLGCGPGLQQRGVQEATD